jgi:hypothetical protein
MAEKRTIELEIQDNSKSLKAQYREAVAELQKVSTQYGETSKEAVKAARAAAELKDQIGFSKDLVDAFNPDAKFKAVEGAVNGVMNGFQAFTGGMALLGVESTKVEEALLKVQSVMALTQGINGIMEAGDSFKILGKKAADAFKGIKAGIAATGIGLLLVAVGTLVAYWDDIKEAVGGVSDEQSTLNKKTEANLKVAEAKVDSLNKQDNILKLQGKTEKEILQLKITELDATIKIAEVNLANQKATKKSQVEAAKRNHDILVGIISFMSIPLELLLKSVDKVASFIGKETGLSDWYKGIKESGANLLFDPAATASEGDAAIKEAENKLLDMKNSQAGYKLQIQQIEREANSKSIQNTSKTEDQKLDLTRQRIDKEIELMEDGYEKERRITEEKAKREKEDLETSIKGKIYDKNEYAKTQKLIEDNLQKDLAEIDEKYLGGKAAVRDFTIQSLIDQKTKEGEIEIEAAGKKIELDKKTNEEILANQQRLNDLRFKAAKDTLQVISNVTELFAGKSKAQQKKAFQIQKAVNIAGATMDTYKAAASALKDSPAPFNFIAMAAVITAGLLNVKKIASQKFEGGGSSGGGGGESGTGAGATMTPQFNVVGNNGINQLAQLQQQPVQAYVVSGEVTSAQALDRNRVQNATL